MYHVRGTTRVKPTMAHPTPHHFVQGTVDSQIGGGFTSHTCRSAPALLCGTLGLVGSGIGQRFLEHHLVRGPRQLTSAW